MELMDIKWCMASVLRRAEKFKQITGRDDFREAHVSTLGLDKSKVTCFRCRENGNFKRKCTNREASGAQNPFGNNDYYKKAIYHQVSQQPFQQQQAQHQAQTAHGRNVIEDSKRACLVNQGKNGGFSWDKYITTDNKVYLADQDDEKLPEDFSWDNFCPDQEFMAKEMSKDMSNTKAFVVNASDQYWAEKYRKIREAEEEKRRRFKEEDIERRKAETEKKKRTEEVQVRTVKEIPEFEIKVDPEAVKVLEKCLNCDSLIKQNNELLHNIKRLKESYDTLNREMNKYQESNREQAVAMNTLKGAYMRQLDDINFYTKKCAELELTLATQKIETERVNNLLKSYSCSTFVVDKIYPIVEELKTFEEEKTSEEKKSETKEEDKEKISGKKPSVVYDRCPPPVENGYSPRNPNSERVKKATNLKWGSGSSDNLPENIDVTFTSSDTDHESELI
ncbi:putative transcription factor interactor and regulator CCHC(Zn) family [Helianthus anomalus]